MANVANLSIVRSEPASAAIEVAGLSHIYAGRDGAGAGADRHRDDGRTPGASS